MPYDKTPYSVIPKTPYSFVPISDRVFFPDWADRISQDVPFSDALSGSITFDIVAKTPVFVRNGQIAGGKDSSFSHMPDGTFFLPGTSIKGEIASVLRMMSFGKMGQVADKTFGNRNLNDPSYRSRMKDVFCGWMRLTKEGAEIIDCDIPKRISVSEIDKKLGTHLESFVKDGFNFNRDENRMAKKKYSLLPAGKEPSFLFRDDDELTEKMREKNPVDPREFVTFARGEGYRGTIVFTGQPGVRKQVTDRRTGRRKWTGKFYEFVFLKYDDEILRPVSETLFKAFESIHASSPDYEGFWKKKLYDGEKIPVFFILNDDDTIHSIGLSYLYKYPYKKSIRQSIPEEHKKEEMDLGECLFGTVQGASCKGRVQFGHAKASGHPVPMDDKVFRMSQPRASFYPFYVEGGKSWDDAVKISGHKRYPIRFGRPLPSPQGTKDMESSAAMLPPGTTFKETVRFHNLRPVELGALLSAITFHGNQDQCFHSIGFGKPLGYGAVSIQNIALEGVDVQDNPVGGINEYLAAFEDQMTAFTSNWLSSPQMSELLLMAQGIPVGKESSFEYMPLDDFREAKRSHTALKPFSSRIGKAGYSVPSVKK